MVAVLVVDADPDVVDAVKLAFRAQPYELLGETSAARALLLLRQRRIDVVISEESMPDMCDGEFLERAYQQQPDAVRIVLTGFASLDAALRAVNHGRVSRFLLKPCDPEELQRAVSEALIERATRVSRASLPIPPSATHIPGLTLLPPLAGLSDAQARSLSASEYEVLSLLAAGLRVATIASRLFISPHTVRNHLKTVYRKLDIHSQTALIEYARGRPHSMRREDDSK